MHDAWGAIFVLMLFVASAVLFARLRNGAGGGDERGLPRELVGAEVAFAEQTFRSARNGLIAKLDRAYRLEGQLKLVELKTRLSDVVYMVDVVEMSVQRLALQDQTGEPVSMDAWVVVQSSNTGSRRPHRVRLLGRDEIDSMAKRYRQIRIGRISDPTPARSNAQCKRCSHCDRCAATFHDR
ncbi:hypothetical protein CDN99_15820 [Roseateles aquatilis]|jgi:CRISPR-associated exonuclease Cas4|uniref:PD-(D/E)XK endonuclease-like domain-containing protein n=1 Tax=Roseateles aquatilis TaxID=431061 RepID=A0A246J8Q3_9BURK|nr:PD-(D/E)XK nuclease family protein [Roseateles aquatilis]MBY0366045.1 PD-(D/E)XK nuclease family protein [Burkholderiaceae bacterium]OWQ88936.1 hypothetical protein CDN99_15820 [Roseateles aquatilis]